MRAADTAATGQACVDTSPPACEPPDFAIAAASCEIAVESAAEIVLACALSDCCWIAAAGSSFARWPALAICCSSAASCFCSRSISAFNWLTAGSSDDAPDAPSVWPLAPVAS